MKNMLRDYLGDKYSSNHLRNFCLYWIKAFECKASYPSEDEWRRENDMDCLYFDGDLKADTLMSAWTPIKWVANCINRDIGISFCKTSRIHSDPYHDLKLLAKDGDSYLPPDHELVKLLNRFLELAEQRCNFILLPEREMNPDRYRILIGNTTVWLCDEVPATLAHVFDSESLGKYFPDKESVIKWIRREHLEMGFADGKIDLYHVLPLINGHDPYTPLWPKKENEIAQALEYMIDFLEKRMKILIDIENGAAIKEDEADSGEYTENVSEKIGDICVLSKSRGNNKVALAIGDVFKKMIECEKAENIGRIDFSIKGDVLDEELMQIDNCIVRLCKWYGRDNEIGYAWKCQKDKAVSDICEIAAVVHLKGQRKISVPMKAKSIKDDDLKRPEGMTDDALWELYRLFHNMYRPYLWVSMGGRGKYRLFLVNEVAFGHGETDYGVGNMGIELPWSRKEWLDLKVTALYDKCFSVRNLRISTDAISCGNDSAEQVLAANDMKLPEGIC
ncbi:MAG: hypothetical protein K6F73_00040 [Lachnospiraceae bacterium]|nr:hypothetical protein [Lachnospiraceae bacterium]